MAERQPRKIESLEALQKVVPLIVKAVNDDAALGLRAAANPLLAAEELGFEITPEIQRIAERRVRFSQENADRLGALEEQVYQLAKGRFDIDAPQAVERVLFEKLKLPRPKPPSEPPATPKQQASPIPYGMSATPLPRSVDQNSIDPLEYLRGAHQVMEPLLEYRSIERSSARLAPRELYERIRRGEVKMPITRIQVRLKRSRTPK